jgi:hypothetical protein
MKISLHQKGGLFGGDRSVDLSEDDLRVTEGGRPVTERTLTPGERAKVGEVAKRLYSKTPSQAESGLMGASDSMLTEVEIDEEDELRTYRVRSGDDAPDELWELVGTLTEVAETTAPDASSGDASPTHSPSSDTTSASDDPDLPPTAS